MTITYVTGNPGKYISVKEKFAKHNLPVEFFNYDFEEPDINDIELISKAKVEEAYKILNKPCFVADSGFYVKNYPGNPGYPGAFAKRSGISENVNLLLEAMNNVKDREACFLDCVTFYDGNEYYTFFGLCEGTISYEQRGRNMEKAKSKLWYVFVPKHHDKTLAEMTDEERNNRQDGHTSAYEEFINWYEEVYLTQRKLTKKSNS
ncbi:MAG: hypothetical protein K2H20_04150 [Bacilli bacterium]|nr:hypothetical protein [Bacilli bacterium]